MTDLLVCFVRYGGALVFLVAAILVVVHCCILADHYHWTRRWDRAAILDIAAGLLWACAGALMTFCSFAPVEG